MKEQYQPSREEIKKAENMMTDDNKHDSAMREPAVNAGEAYFEDFAETKQFTPDKSLKAENVLQEQIMKELESRIRELGKSYSEMVSSLLEKAEHKSDEDANLTMEEIQKITERLVEGLGDQLGRFHDVYANAVETVSDFVIHKKNELLQQETDEQRKQELVNSIHESEKAKIIRLKKTDELFNREASRIEKNLQEAVNRSYGKK